MPVWLPSIIDVEASGFGANSYPIEIGVVRSDGARYCKLIKPLSDWLHWDKEAEALHGIRREVLLTHGLDAVEVCHELNQFLHNEQLYSDA
ncbi:hypothetical protein [Alteromonas oceanisediminis]|uniref:hypothetical protein n=1 Tax=Alteromonas oceanisediminis TaxID=2836180 RepID=UPI0028F3FDEE|nr:hypothetical protein [Alteromonas oceanisediminis]